MGLATARKCRGTMPRAASTTGTLFGYFSLANTDVIGLPAGSLSWEMEKATLLRLS